MGFAPDLDLSSSLVNIIYLSLVCVEPFFFNLNIAQVVVIGPFDGGKSDFFCKSEPRSNLDADHSTPGVRVCSLLFPQDSS